MYRPWRCRTSSLFSATCFLIVPCLCSAVCPPGVAPGQFYPDTTKIWQYGIGQGHDHRCKTNNYAFQGPANAQCMPWLPGEQPRCVYNGNVEHGGYYCPLQTSTNPSCIVSSSKTNCTDENHCIDPANYGLCKCSQCPCSLPGQYGRQCDICTSAGTGWGPAFQLSRGVHTGQRFICDFHTDFLYTSYALLFPGMMAQPKVEVEIVPNGFNMRIYWDFCTQKEQLLVWLNFTDCETGVKAACQAQNIPTPCYKCGQSVAMGFPPDTFLPATTKAIIGLVGTGGTMFGCKTQGVADTTETLECKIYYDAFPLDWGWPRCVAGTTCIGNTTNGTYVNITTLVNDEQATQSFVLYLLLFTVLFFIICALIVCLGAKYTFKTDASRVDVPGVALSWANLSVGDIITDVTGQVIPGALVGILGPIGAGKSTLLKTLCGRISPTGGVVSINSSPVKAVQLRQVIGYVPQEDVCCPDDTVAEAIGFAVGMSRGKFPEVHPVLRNKLNKRIGTLSGGQRRMTAIYVELARLPEALLLDEPTTGLDSDSALELMNVLKKVAETIPILATIHQPGPEIAEFFHELTILADGKQICHAGSFLEQTPALPELQALVQMAAGPQGQGHYAVDDAIDFAAEGKYLGFTDSPKRSVNSGLESGKMPSFAHSSSGASSSLPRLIVRKVPAIPRQFFFIGVRNIKRSLRRSPANIVSTLIGAVCIGFCYFQVDDTLNGVRGRFGAMFMLHAFLALQAVGATSETKGAWTLTEHEISSYIYLRAVDAGAKVLGQLFGQLPHAIVAAVVVQIMVGLREDGSRPVVFVICVTATAVCCAFTALCARQRSRTYTGTIRACVFNGILLFFCGFLLGENSAQDYLAWGFEISAVRYSFELLLAHEFIGLKTVFNPKNADAIVTRGGLYLKQYGMVSTLEDEFYALGHKLGWLTAIWMLIAFIILLMPPGLYCECRRFVPVRVSGQGQLQILLSWVAQLILPDGNDFVTQSPLQPTSVGAQQKEDDVSPTLVDLDICSEMYWEGLGNKDISNISGGLCAGCFLGIVGPCGSGKTTLLTMLAGRVAPSTGKIWLGGKVASPRQLAKHIGYVPQVSHLFEEDVLNDALTFAAEMSCGSPKLLNAAAAGNQGAQRIGRLSGGQQRVAAVAVELVRRPYVLVLDEPLSGLDGASCLQVARLLKLISQSTPVIITMHQPRPELVEMLTHVMVMHLGQLCVSLPCRHLRNGGSSVAPSEACEETNVNNDTSAALHDARPLDRILHAVEEYAKAPQIVEYKCLGSATPPMRRRITRRMCGRVLKREFQRLWLQRPVRSFWILMTWLLAGILVGAAYSKMEAFTTTGVLERSGLFFVLNCTVAVLTLPRVFYFHEMRQVVMHELESRILHPFFYHVCQSVVDLTHRLLCAVIFCAMVLIIVPFEEKSVHKDGRWQVPKDENGNEVSDNRHAILILTIAITALACGHMADAISAFSKNPLSASSAYAGVVIFMSLFGASFVAVDSRQVESKDKFHAESVSVLSHLSIFFYSWLALMENEIIDSEFDFKVSGIRTTRLSGKEWCDVLDVPERLTGNLLLLLGWAMLFWVLAGLGLLYQTSPRRRSASPSS